MALHRTELEREEGGGVGVRDKKNGEGMGEREKHKINVQIIGQKLFLTYSYMPQ